MCGERPSRYQRKNCWTHSRSIQASGSTQTRRTIAGPPNELSNRFFEPPAVAGMMQSGIPGRSTTLTSGRQEMRLGNEKGIAALSLFALAAGITLLVRLIQRERRRRSMRDTAVET